MEDNKSSRVSLNFPNKVIIRVKNYAKKVGITDTDAYSLLLGYGLRVAEFLDNDEEYLRTIKKDIKYVVLNEPINEDDNSLI